MGVPEERDRSCDMEAWNSFPGRIRRGFLGVMGENQPKRKVNLCYIPLQLVGGKLMYNSETCRAVQKAKKNFYFDNPYEFQCNMQNVYPDHNCDISNMS